MFLLVVEIPRCPGCAKLLVGPGRSLGCSSYSRRLMSGRLTVGTCFTGQQTSCLRLCPSVGTLSQPSSCPRPCGIGTSLGKRMGTAAAIIKHSAGECCPDERPNESPFGGGLKELLGQHQILFSGWIWMRSEGVDNAGESDSGDDRRREASRHHL